MLKTHPPRWITWHQVPDRVVIGEFTTYRVPRPMIPLLQRNVLDVLVRAMKGAPFRLRRESTGRKGWTRWVVVRSDAVLSVPSEWIVRASTGPTNVRTGKLKIPKHMPPDPGVPHSRLL